MAEKVQKVDTESTLVNMDHALSAAPHTLDSSDVLKQLATDARRGLSSSEVQKLQEQYGPNRLKPPRRPSLMRICGRQILNAMTLVLIAATAVSLGTRDWSGVIFESHLSLHSILSLTCLQALVIMNVSVGTYTEWKSEKTVASLEAVGSPNATVTRSAGDEKAGDGRTSTINIEEVVPGDIIVLVNGDVVPADARLIEGYLAGLESDEALLTGESLPIAKRTEIIDEPNCPVGDRKNMVFSGSQITKGRARAVVTSIGMSTELGAIAAALERKEKNTATGWAARRHKLKVILGLAETTPLQVKLNWLAYILLAAACLVAFIVVASTAFTNVPLSVATYAVAAAVSLLPASLIAVVSLTLATSSRDLAKRNALVRRMDAIEALAQVTDVCSDKTGTLTVGKMVVRKAWTPFNEDKHELGQEYEVESGSDPFFPRGSVKPIVREEEDEEKHDTVLDALDVHDLDPALHDLALCGGLANMATLSHAEGEDHWSASGDATEIALQVFAHKLGLGKPHLTHPPRALKRQISRQSAHGPLKRESRGHYELLVEHSFDSSVKRMSTAYHYRSEEEEEHVLVLMKGAVERCLERCTRMGLEDSGPQLTAEERENIISKMDELAEEGLRVLALCGRKESTDRAGSIKDVERSELEQKFGFLGLVGIYDPPRPESAGAIAECKIAGIVPRMLTGDHPATAVAIATKIGLLDRAHPKHAVMTGQQFDALSDQQVDELPELPVVIARCAPETKVRMIEALHRRKRSAAMTGDGVNDAPALKRADIGIAMGLNGSDVAKQSADIVLADDNFATIIRAIRKGRSVYNNLSKFLLYLLSGNLAEVIVLLIGLAFMDENGLSVFPLSPLVAALWINTLAAGPPAFALGLEPTSKDAMLKPPSAFRTIFTKAWFCDLFFYGIVMSIFSIVSFVIVVWGQYDGNLGLDCNEGPSDICDNVFVARAMTFATLVIILMVQALVCKHQEKSLFSINWLDNKTLLATVVVLSLATFPVIYIPVIDSEVFFFESLTWHWGVVAGFVIVYLAITELYKMGRRRYAPKPPQPSPKSLRLADTIEVGGA